MSNPVWHEFVRTSALLPKLTLAASLVLGLLGAPPAAAAAQDPCAAVTVFGDCKNLVPGESNLLYASAEPPGGSFTWVATQGGMSITPNYVDDSTIEFSALQPGIVELTVFYYTPLGCTASQTCRFLVEPDTDGDGVPDTADDCWNVYDPDQADTDGDGTPDVCEPACEAEIASGMGIPGSTVPLTAWIHNTGQTATTYHFSILATDPSVTVVIAGGSGSVALAPGQSFVIPFDVVVDPLSPSGSTPLDLQIATLQGSLCNALGAFLVDPTPPPPPCKVDLVLHVPPVANVAMPAVPDDPGVQVFINNDNDDRQEKYDLDNPTVHSENEMSKATLRIQPPTLDKGNLRLHIKKGKDFVRIWYRSSKGKAYVDNERIPVNKLGKSADGNWLETELWIEGVKPQTQQKDTELELNYDEDASCTNSAFVTVIGIKQSAWLGDKNGFTDGSNKFDSDTLDKDPNFPAVAGVEGYRVFPDGRAEDAGADKFVKLHDKVKLEIELTVAPVDEFVLFVRGYDVDDPADDAAIDPNDNGSSGAYPGTGSATSGGTLRYDDLQDNRGIVGGRKSGKFDGDDAYGIAEIKFKKDEAKKSIPFRVSQYAGDNYRAVAHVDRLFLINLRNRDKDDGIHVVDPKTKDPGTTKPIPVPAPYQTSVLTVWRLVHVERDSFKALEAKKNSAIGKVEAIDNDAKTITIVAAGLKVNDVAAAGLDDGSGGTDGRFQHGTLASVAGIDVAAKIVKNANLRFDMEVRVELDCTIQKGAATVNTKVTRHQSIAGGSKIKVKDALTAAQFNGGKITIGDSTFDIATNTADEVTTTGAALLAFIAVDDDRLDVLPEESLADVTLMNQAYNPAYLLPVFDGGGTSGKETTDLDPIANTPATDTGAFEAYFKRDSLANERDSFWIVYVVSEFQLETNSDRDPDDEGGTGGVVFGITDLNNVSKGGNGAGIFLETIRDRLNEGDAAKKAKAGLEARIVPHEVGHQFGLAHDDSTDNIMNSTNQNGPLGASYQFTFKALNLLRCRKVSPGQ